MQHSLSGASAWIEPYHDRMPVLLEEKEFDAWLDRTLGPYTIEGGIIQYARGFVAARRGCWLVSTNGLTKDQATVVISARAAQA
jgi:hypothetical protein